MKKFQRLRDLREDKDLTQKEAAQIFYMHPTQYQRYENCEGTSFTDFLMRAADYYGVSLDYIAGRTNLKKENEKDEITEEEINLIKDYRRISKEGKIRIQERIETIIESEAEQSAMTRGRRSS